MAINKQRLEKIKASAWRVLESVFFFYLQARQEVMHKAGR